MLTKFMVAALCMVLLSTGSFAEDEVIVEKEVIVVSTTNGDGAPQILDLRNVSEGAVTVLSLEKLKAAGEKLAGLIAKLEQSGDVSANGAAKLNAMIEEIGAKLGGGIHGQGNVMFMGNSGISKNHGHNVMGGVNHLEIDGVINNEIISQIKELKNVYTDKEELAVEIQKLFESKAGEFGGEMDIELEILNLSGEADGAAQAYVVKMLGDVDIAHAGGHIPAEMLTKIEKIKKVHGEDGEIAIELKMLYENEADKAHEAHGAHKDHHIIMKKLHEKHECKGDECDHAGHGALVEIHEGKLKELHEKMQSAHGKGKHGSHGLQTAPHPPVMKHMAPAHGLSMVSEIGHSEGLDAWFGKWDTIMEELAVDLSAVQLDLIQNQLDEAKKFLDAVHGAHGFGGMTIPGWESAEGLSYLFSEDGNFFIPGLSHGEELEMMWIGEDGEISLDVDELKAEIEKLVQELVEEKQAK